jgi:hypothetical protein
MSQTFNGQSGGMIASLLPSVMPQQQMVYGLDGTAYPSADAARAAGVFDFRYAPPMAPVPTSMPAAMPMAQPAGLPFAMPAARGSFNPMALRGSGLLSETGSAVLPNNVPMYENTWKVPDYLAPARVQAAQASAGMDSGGGGYDGMYGGSYTAYADPNSYTGGLVGALVGNEQTYAPVVDMTTIGGVNSPTYGQVDPGGFMGPGYGGVGGGYEGSIDNSMSQSDMMGAQEAGMNDSGGGDGGGSSKIVCTAMNHAYGFGGFRNKIWLAYAAKHLTKAHEVGYHTLFLPLVAIGYNQGGKMHNRIVRRVLENIARHRSTDLRAEMRGTKRDPVGRVYRLILEPLCFAVGKLKGY